MAPRGGQVLIIRAFAELARIHAADGVDLRQGGPFGLAQHGGGLLDAAHGEAKVGVGDQGLRDQGVELGVAERLPPLGADGHAALTGFGKDLGLRQLGPHVIRTDGATGEEEDGTEDETGHHGWAGVGLSFRPDRRWKNQGMNKVATKVSSSMPPSTPVPIDWRARSEERRVGKEC